MVRWSDHVAGLLADRYTGTLLEPIRYSLKHHAEKAFSRLSDHPKLPPIYESSPKKIWLYALVDPRDQTVRYIGVTGAPKSRLHWHMQDPLACTRDWIRELGSVGEQPLLVVLGRTCKTHWQAVERSWISFFRWRGGLYNESDGGKVSGSIGVPRSVGAKQAARMERKRHQETLLKSKKPKKRRAVRRMSSGVTYEAIVASRPLKPVRRFEMPDE